MCLDRDNISFSAPNLMNVCVDGSRNSDINGRLFHRGQAEPVYFENSSRMIFEMERWCDRIGCPQPEVMVRKFNKKNTDVHIRRTEEELPVAGDELIKNEGEEGTFLIHIKYRQNATWQGQVTWAEKKKSCNFRSTLELLKLIDSALDEKKV